MKFLLIILIFISVDIFAGVDISEKNYNAALEILRDGNNNEENVKAYLLLLDASEKHHVLSSGLLAAIKNSCLIENKKMPICSALTNNKKLMDAIKTAQAGAAMYHQKNYQKNGELCLIIGAAWSGLFLVEDEHNINYPDIYDWINGDVIEQYKQAGKWLVYSVHYANESGYYPDYVQSVNALLAANDEHNKYSQFLLDELFIMHPETKNIIQEGIKSPSSCLVKKQKDTRSR